MSALGEIGSALAATLVAMAPIATPPSNSADSTPPAAERIVELPTGGFTAHHRPKRPDPNEPAQLIFPVTGHAAFPSLVEMPSGIRLAYRYGTDHVAMRDGSLLISSTTDLGRHFTDPAVLRDTPNEDDRDPTLAYIDGELWTTWFTGSAAVGAEGVWVQRGDRTPVRVDSLPYAAIAAPVRQLQDGSVAVVYYGKAAGAPRESAWFARSSDGGVTWTSRVIADGPAAGRDYQEPWLVVDGSRLIVTHRYGSWDGIGVTTSNDSGQSWFAPRKVLDNATGRPNVTMLRSGALVMTYRHAGTRDGMITISRDGGGTWSAPQVLFDGPDDDIGFAYADMLELPMSASVPTGTILVVLSVETGDTAGLWRMWISENSL